MLANGYWNALYWTADYWDPHYWGLEPVVGSAYQWYQQWPEPEMLEDADAEFVILMGPM